MRYTRRRHVRWTITALIILGIAPSLIFTESAQAAPGTATSISHQLGFDTACAPSVSVMQEWWNKSPYWDVGVYLGGENAACPGGYTRSWIDQVYNQGWNFIPVWVGPQAPCSTLPDVTKMSWDPGTAFNQGVDQAQAAMYRANDLGMTEFTIIYYDLEAYNTGNGSCVNVVHKFLEGFNRHLKNSSRRAGTYGSSGGSGATGWASICCGGVPDQVWLANWNGQVTTQSIPPVPDSYWIYDQRIHQYEGDVTDGPGFGATALNIDKNCLNGMVAGTEHTGVTRQCY